MPVSEAKGISASYIDSIGWITTGTEGRQDIQGCLDAGETLRVRLPGAAGLSGGTPAVKGYLRQPIATKLKGGVRVVFLLKYKCATIIIVILVLSALILVPALVLYASRTGCGKPDECQAISRTTLGVLSTQTGEISIPGNAGIIKIIASIIDHPTLQTDGAIIESGPAEQLSFSYAFTIDPAINQGSFEITFEEPVCVGEEGAQMRMRAFSFNIADPIAYIMTLTVVYCPDHCSE
jgi:hypothetical protein